jgi:hypothetical protein
MNLTVSHPYELIYRSAWKVNSAKFALMEFSEVQLCFDTKVPKNAPFGDTSPP